MKVDTCIAYSRSQVQQTQLDLFQPFMFPYSPFCIEAASSLSLSGSFESAVNVPASYR